MTFRCSLQAIGNHRQPNKLIFCKTTFLHQKKNTTENLRKKKVKSNILSILFFYCLPFARNINFNEQQQQEHNTHKKKSIHPQPRKKKLVIHPRVI
jgi:hypothetical protein